MRISKRKERCPRCQKKTVQYLTVDTGMKHIYVEEWKCEGCRLSPKGLPHVGRHYVEFLEGGITVQKRAQQRMKLARRLAR